MRVRKKTRQTPDGLAVVEIDPNGHRLMYVARLLKDAMSAGRNVELLITQEVRGARQYEEFIVPIVDGPGLHVRIVSSRLKANLSAIRLIRAVSQGRTLILLDGDRWLTALYLGWPRRQPAVVLLMRTSEARNIQNLLKRLLVLTLRWLKTIKVTRLVGPLEPSDAEMKPVWGAVAPVNDLLPERHDISRGAARQRLGLPMEQQVLLIAGSIDARKSVHQVLNWIASIEANKRPVLLLAGQRGDSLADVFGQSQSQQLVESGAVVSLDRFLSNQELHDCYAACNVVLILNENEGPSGALAYAVASERPVLGWGSKDVTSAIQVHGLGVVARSRTSAELSRALSALATWNGPVHKTEESLHFAQGKCFLSQLLTGVDG